MGIQNLKGKMTIDSAQIDKIKGYGQTAQDIYNSDDKIKSMGTVIPSEYQAQYDTAVSAYNKSLEIKQKAEELQEQAAELKRKKDEAQIQMFEKVISPFWKNYDLDDKGYINQEQFKDLSKMVMDKAGYGDKFNEQVFEELCSFLAVYSNSKDEDSIKKYIQNRLIKVASSTSGININEEMSNLGVATETKVTEADEKQEVKLYKRLVAEILNMLVFQGM